MKANKAVPDMNLRVGIAVYALRQLHGMSQRELAQASLTTQPMISLIENGRRNKSINLNALWRIAKALKQDSLTSLIHFAEEVPDTKEMIREAENLVEELTLATAGPKTFGSAA